MLLYRISPTVNSSCSHKRHHADHLCDQPHSLRQIALTLRLRPGTPRWACILAKFVFYQARSHVLHLGGPSFLRARTCSKGKLLENPAGNHPVSRHFRVLQTVLGAFSRSFKKNNILNSKPVLHDDCVISTSSPPKSLDNHGWSTAVRTS